MVCDLASKFLSSPQKTLPQPYLHKSIEEHQWKDDDGSEGRGQKHYDADFHQLEEVAQHHLQAVWNHAVNGINLLGESVE